MSATFSGKPCGLGHLARGDRALVVRLLSDQDPVMARRLMDLGFLPGEVVTVAQVSPWGGDPIAVKVRGTLVALRRGEADLVEVQCSA